jgi:predicted nuclease of restriction endonuclease-like (RecB) superfamily
MITGEYYERFMIAHKDNNLDQTLVAQQAEDTKLALKDSYLFDFLSLGKKYKEKDLHD